MVKKITNAKFIQVSQLPQSDSHLTAKSYVDNAIYGVKEQSLLRFNPDEKLKLDERDSIVLNFTLTLPKIMIELSTKIMLIKQY